MKKILPVLVYGSYFLVFSNTNTFAKPSAYELNLCGINSKSMKKWDKTSREELKPYGTVQKEIEQILITYPDSRFGNGDHLFGYRWSAINRKGEKTSICLSCVIRIPTNYYRGELIDTDGDSWGEHNPDETDCFKMMRSYRH